MTARGYFKQTAEGGKKKAQAFMFGKDPVNEQQGKGMTRKQKLGVNLKKADRSV